MVPPVVVWRFAEPRPVEFVDVLRGIVDDESREIDWVLDTTRRNWVLVPSRVMAEKEAHHFATEAQAVALLEQEDPEFCLHSVNDLERIVAALDRSADFPVSGCATS
ncbi:hypothetical protein [Nocardia tenerifensis]|nr:hypothetical protein [Nocardia tenerifensis]